MVNSIREYRAEFLFNPRFKKKKKDDVDYASIIYNKRFYLHNFQPRSSMTLECKEAVCVFPGVSTGGRSPL